jgi:hypothetical protein
MAAETVVAALNEEKYEATSVGRLIFSASTQLHQVNGACWSSLLYLSVCLPACLPVCLSIWVGGWLAV